MEIAFEKTYVQAASIAMMWRKELIPPQKDGVDDMYQTHFEKSLVHYARVKAGSRITNITGTTKDLIESAVESATQQAMNDGLSVNATRDLILEYMKDSYKEFTSGRAQTIAQTEMNTAANEAAFEAGKSTGLETRKFWSTSGLDNTRESHLQAEADSIDQGGLAEDEAFSNGLMFPGDPGGDWPEEVCNCRCCLLIEIV